MVTDLEAFTTQPHEGTTDVSPNQNAGPAKWMYMIFTIICLVFAMIILVSNSIFITACWRTRSLRTISMLYVISLAVSDMLQGIGMILQAFFYANKWIGIVMWTDFLCPWILAIFLTCVPLSILNVAFIAVDRYVYIIHPYRYPEVITARRSKVAITIIWLVWSSFGFSILNQPQESSECRTRTVVRVSYIWIRFIVFFVSSAVSGFCHVSIQLAALKHIRRVHPYPYKYIKSGTNVKEPSVDQSGGITMRTIRLMKTFLLVFVSQLVCWTPALVVQALEVPRGGLTNLVIVLAEIGALVNVFVYVFSNKQIRRAIFRMVCHKTASAYWSDND